MTVSAPERVAQIIFSTSSSMEEATAEFPILALIFTRKFRPMIIGSSSGWLILLGMMARPRATSSRTNSAVISDGMLAPQECPACWETKRSASRLLFLAGPLPGLLMAGSDSLRPGVFPSGKKYLCGGGGAVPGEGDWSTFLARGA